MIRKSNTVLLLGIWVAVTAALLLAPTPRGLGDFGRRFSISYDEIKSVLQPTVHFIVMALGALLMMRLLIKRPVVPTIILSVGIALLVAFLLELSQHMLPEQFSRACDMGDLVPSLAGAVCGAFVGLIFRYFMPRGRASC